MYDLNSEFGRHNTIKLCWYTIIFLTLLFAVMAYYGLNSWGVVVSYICYVYVIRKQYKKSEERLKNKFLDEL